MDKVGIGFIGAGFAADLHAHALAPLRGVTCELVAVCSRTRERAEGFARKFGIPHAYTDHRALLDRKDVHLVTLPVVTSLHHVFAIEAAGPASTSSWRNRSPAASRRAPSRAGRCSPRPRSMPAPSWRPAGRAA